MKNLKIDVEYTLIPISDSEVKITQKRTVVSYDEWLMDFLPAIQLLGFYVAEIKTFPHWSSEDA